MPSVIPMHTAIPSGRSAPAARTRLFSAVACLLASSPWVHAEETTLPTITVKRPAVPRLDHPIDTGSLLDLSAKQTPASVEAITRDQLEQRGDTSLNAAVTRATGISSLAHPGNSGSALSARGFTDSTSVMRLYDGLRQYGGVGVSFPFHTWSVERIEVLRGPASVIHGDGAIGGAVNIVPKKPTRGATRSEVQASLGTEGKRSLAFGSGGGLNEHFSFRVDASTDRSDGWVDRGDSRSGSFSGALRFDATPDLALTLSHAWGKQQPMQYFGMPLVDGRPVAALVEKNYNVADSAIEFRDRWTDLSVQWTPNASVTVRSRLYHVQSDRYWRNAETYVYNTGTGLVDRSGNTEIAHDQVQTGNTTSVTYRGELFGMANQTAIGFDANAARFQHTNNTYAGSSGSVDPVHPLPGLFIGDAPFIPRYRNDADQYALFAEDRLALDAHWSVVAGLRYDHAEVNRTDLVAGTRAFDERFENAGGRIGVVYQPSQDTALYAQFAKAADPVSGMLMLSPANAGFDLSTGKQLELGAKQGFWQGRGEWTVAVYQIRKTNLLTRDTADPSKRLQVGERSSTGVEGSLSLAITPALQLDANVAILRARYDDFTDSVRGVAVSRAGNVPPDVPERLANIWANWRFMPEWTASGGVRHVGKRYADNANTLELPGYTTTDLALQWRPTADSTVSLRGFNVFDRTYYTSSYYTTTQWFVGEGRRVELTLNQRF